MFIGAILIHFIARVFIILQKCDIIQQINAIKVQTFKQELYNARIIIIAYRETRGQTFGANQYRNYISSSVLINFDNNWVLSLPLSKCIDVV